MKGNSVVPPPDGTEFSKRGDLFSERFTDLALTANGSVQVNLGFTVNFGSGVTSSLFVNENGIVSFGRALSANTGGAIAASSFTAAPQAAFQPVTSLDQFGVPVIAPFYADLLQGRGAGDGQLGFGDVVVQLGQADPFADGGSYRAGDLTSAARITWYGLDVANGTSRASAQTVFAQLLISAAGPRGENSSFEFRYGTLEKPEQAGFGSIAGFYLGGNLQQFSGPYTDGIPTFFEFENGKYIGQDVSAAVPEPALWLEFILGFGIIGWALRRVRRTRLRLAA